MKADSLKSQTTQALFWSFWERFGQQGVQFVVSVILARLLLPEEFGLVAMLSFFIAVAETFVNSGFGQALIQKQNTSRIDENSIFYFNIVVGVGAAILLCFIAPLIADFYSQPSLEPLTCALSVNLIFNSFGLVQTALLTKNVNFKAQLQVSVFATLISGFVGITLALIGFGVWSLVAQSLSANFFRAIFLWIFNSWRPSLEFSFRSLCELFVFGSRLLASGLLDTIFKNIYLVVIGKLFSPVSLGFYSRAQGLQQLPASNLSLVVSRVTFPVFSSVQDDKPRLKRGVRKALSMLVLVNFPMMVGLAIVANPLVILLLTEKWQPCVPYLQLLCVVGLLHPLHVINLNVLTAQGRSDLFFRLELIKKLLVVVALIITCQWGITAIIYGQIATSLLSYFVNAYYTRVMIDYSLREQIGDVIPCFLTSLLMGVCVYLFSYVDLDSMAIFMFLQIIIGASIYVGSCILFKIEPFLELLDIIKSKFSELSSI